MSFGSAGFGGFGQNNNATAGGFGTNNPPTSGFGSNTFGGNTTTGNPQGGGIFGNSGGGFGAASGSSPAFGAQSAGFGAKPGFGTATPSSGGGLFGATPAAAPNTSFGGTSGFGSASTSSPFGGGSSMFGGGASKPAGFGAASATSTPASGGLFGGGTGGFGSTNTGAFGATNNPGIGTSDNPPGTGLSPFAAVVERESNGQSNSYQNVLFMDQYKKWSADELRLVDYTQGRRHGNPGGATGAFGVSSGFGGGFGANTTQPSAFGTNPGSSFGGGATTQPSAGYGATTATAGGGFGAGGNLFGGNKPGGLFGGTPAAQPTTGGGLFGNTNPGGAGFGASGSAAAPFGGQTNTASGGLFGGTAAKPAAFGFGSQPAASGGFGSAAPAATGAFGTTNPGTGLFGAPAQASTGTAGFGALATQQPATSSFGGGAFGGQNPAAGSSLFGNPQQKPGGLFSNTATPAAGGSLFGGPANTSAFGAPAAQPSAAGGLFGPKPAIGGTGLFSQAATNQPGAATGGLFGTPAINAQQQQPAQTGGLFGGLGQAQAKPSLFGAPQNTAGGGLFGGSTQAPSGGLFGAPQQQQPQAMGLGGSLFNMSQNAQAPGNLSTSIIDPSAYGSQTLFSMQDNKAQDPGPLATPLSGKAKNKSRSILPMYKLSPANASRFATPQKRGFGFSYSTYGTPTSPSSVASTPGGLGQSLLMGSINRGLSKSISASNLRRSLNVEDSILQPGAFSSSSGPRLLGNGGSHKKLVINREMRSDLFISPKKDTQSPDNLTVARKLTKRVSFDTNPTDGAEDSSAKTPEPASNPPEDLGYLRPTNQPPNGIVNGDKSTPVIAEPEQVKGNELAIVHEEEPAVIPVVETADPSSDKTPGAYWMLPSREEVMSMNRMQRQKVTDFTVGRENIGSVRFKVPVDLSNIDVDDLFHNIVILEPRSATVYPNTAKKPAVGKGLNVPAIISLEQSQPRGRDKKTPLQDKAGPRLQKHIERLKKIKNTTFESYDAENGIWVFSVEHFTTYALDEEEDETRGDVTETSQIVPQPTGQYEAASPDVASPETYPDDTFDFKRVRRPVPGAFDQSALSDDEAMDILREMRRAPSVTSEDAEPYYVAEARGEDEVMVDGAYHDAGLEASPRSVDEPDEFGVSQPVSNDAQLPGGVMRARMRAVKKSLAPTKIEVAGGNDWTQILQASVKAPRPTDRAALRALNESGAAWDVKEHDSPVSQTRHVSDGAGFATSIDLMKSLFDQSKGPAQPTQAPSSKGFVKWPYQRRKKIDEHHDDVPASRPEWGPNGTLVTATDDGLALLPGYGVTSTTGAEKLAQLQQYIDVAKVSIRQGMPAGPSLRLTAQGDPAWELATILFEEGGAGLSAFWEQLVAGATTRSISRTPVFEEKAIACLAGNLVSDAAENLLAAGNFRLANLVSSIGAESQDLRAQVNDWKESNVLSEFSEPIRAIYELLGGNPCTCTGVKGVSIENRVSSFIISQRFNLDWMQSFGLRLFYIQKASDISDAVRSFQADIEQDREPEPDSPLWFLLKVFATGKFDWEHNSLEWLLTKAIFSTGKVDFGLDAPERLDQASIACASTLTAAGQWVPATFVLIHLSDLAAREATIRDHLGRHAHLIGSPKDPKSAFAAMLKFGIPDPWLWEARALYFRSKQDSQQEYLALMWAKNFSEANRTFLDRLAPELVIRREYKRLYALAELLFKVKERLPDWDQGALAYLVYPMVRTQDKRQPIDRWDDRLFDGLVSLRAATHGDIQQEAAIADMAEDLLRCRGSDHRLLQLLPEDVKARHVRNRALVV